MSGKYLAKIRRNKKKKTGFALKKREDIQVVLYFLFILLSQLASSILNLQITFLLSFSLCLLVV